MTVVNKRTHIPTSNDQYIGRGSTLGNPFRIGPRRSRDDVIKDYEVYARRRMKRDWQFKQAILDTEGKNLVCFCKPLACHGDVVEMLREELKVL